MDTEYTEQDIMDNLGLVHKMAQDMAPRHINSFMDYDDLVNEGIFGLVKAFKSFDPEKKIRFSTWAGRKIQYAILEAHRKGFRQFRQARRFGLPTPTYLYLDAISSEDGSPNHEFLEGTFLSEDELIDTIDSKLVVDKAWHRLTPRQQRILTLMDKGLTLQEVADETGVTQTAVHMQYHKALDKIRSYHLKFRPGRAESGRP
jgi:RNA polymerase sigma factor (sigma-70 family)